MALPNPGKDLIVPSELDIYAKQTFGQQIVLGNRLALVVVDFVNGFLDPEIFGGGNIVDAANNTVPVVGLFRENNAPVVFTRVVYSDDGSDHGVWIEKAPRLAELTETAACSQISDILPAQPGDIIIRKKQASAFFGTDLDGILRARGVDTLVIVGATTSGCVRATVIDAMSLNFRPVVLTDCVGDRAMGPHEANLFDMGQKYANLMQASDAITLFS